jgi:hypothetical protein
MYLISEISMVYSYYLHRQHVRGSGMIKRMSRWKLDELDWSRLWEVNINKRFTWDFAWYALMFQSSTTDSNYIQDRLWWYAKVSTVQKVRYTQNGRLCCHAKLPTQTRQEQKVKSQKLARTINHITLLNSSSAERCSVDSIAPRTSSGNCSTPTVCWEQLGRPSHALAELVQFAAHAE